MLGLLLKFMEKFYSSNFLLCCEVNVFKRFGNVFPVARFFFGASKNRFRIVEITALVILPLGFRAILSFNEIGDTGIPILSHLLRRMQMFIRLRGPQLRNFNASL